MRESIEKVLREAFDPVHLKVVDDSAKHAGHAGAKEGGHFTVEITARAFEGKTRLERHRMVYAALEPIKKSIHALSIIVGHPP